MLIYLDANIVQYVADYESFVFSESPHCPVIEKRLRRELLALRNLVELDHLADWSYVAPRHLLEELRSNHHLTKNQRRVYDLFEKAWHDCVYFGQDVPGSFEIERNDSNLSCFGLQEKDRRHLAEAISIRASWFLTNDGRLLRKAGGSLGAMRLSRPSGCVEEIAVGLFLR